MRSHATEVFADAVRTVVGGEALLAPAALRRLVDQHAKVAAPADPERLSAAETTVKTHVTRDLQEARPA